MSFGTVATDIMYDNLMNRFEYGNMNDPSVYIDENNSRMMTNIRNVFNRLATGLIEEGKKDSAVAVIDRCFELIPREIVPYEFFSIALIENYYKAGAPEKGKTVLQEAFETFNDELLYFLSFDHRFSQTQSINDEIQRNLFFVQRLEQIARTFGDEELSKKIGDAMQQNFERYNAL